MTKCISSSLCINLPWYLGSTSEAKSRIPKEYPHPVIIVHWQNFLLRILCMLDSIKTEDGKKMYQAIDFQNFAAALVGKH